MNVVIYVLFEKGFVTLTLYTISILSCQSISLATLRLAYDIQILVIHIQEHFFGEKYDLHIHYP